MHVRENLISVGNKRHLRVRLAKENTYNQMDIFCSFFDLNLQKKKRCTCD